MIGRAARNADGKVILYADRYTDSMNRAIEETNRRREVQMRYNLEHGITPKTVEKRVAELIKIGATDGGAKKRGRGKAPVPTSADAVGAVVRDHAYDDVEAEIERLTAEMKQAAAELRFEEAAYLRDKIKTLKITGK